MSDQFHNGEITLQELTGERDRAILNGRLIGSAVPAAAHAFVEQQTACALAWLDNTGAPWAAFVEGAKGFAASSSDGSELFLRPAGFAPALRAGQGVGLLFIELETRRRLRVNGTLTDSQENGFRVSVAEAYPNCPKYIQKRSVSRTQEVRPPSLAGKGAGLPADIEVWLRKTDTMFVASSHPERGVDCSHRGGTPGFMKLVSDEIRVPDYPGNSMFGTLGNISVNPAAGLCLLDFEQNVQLQLTGYATLRFGAVEEVDLTAGTGRWWTFKALRWAVSPLAGQKSWKLLEASPHNPSP